MAMNEAETRARLIEPKLKAAGWTDQHLGREFYYNRDYRYTPGKVILVGDSIRRGKPKRVDYLLRYTDGFPIAVVEAESEDKPPDAGLEQAKNYARDLGLAFAYSTNGHKVIEYDFFTHTGREPEGTMFRGGAFAEVKKALLEEFNLHTIVSLPPGTFAPYSDVKTALIFFERPGPTKETWYYWYYELPLPEGLKKFSKGNPIQDEHFEEARHLWKAWDAHRKGLGPARHAFRSAPGSYRWRRSKSGVTILRPAIRTAGKPRCSPRRRKSSPVSWRRSGRS